MSIVSKTNAHGGVLYKVKHTAPHLNNLEATFSLFIPTTTPNPSPKKFPILFFLSGLTCNEDNFAQKGGAFRRAAQLGLAIVMPDTSPRGANVEGENDAFDIGTGAGFYVNATHGEWAKAYGMYGYVMGDLPDILGERFPVINLYKRSIAGHSMGGHGALTLGLKNPTIFSSVSALAPICHPCECDWGKKAFTAYFGDRSSNERLWKESDAVEIASSMKKGSFPHPILIDQGGADEFLHQGGNQLQPNAFVEACRQSDIQLTYRLQGGYDHSFYFVSTFINDHLDWHAKYLGLMPLL